MKKSIQKVLLIALTSLAIVSCKDDDNGSTTTTGATEAIQETVVTNLTNNVIIKTYNELNNKAATLKTKVEALQANLSNATLEEAKTAWQETRAPWERSEGFLYGPVDSEGLDPAMDTWPVDVNSMNNILNGTQAITPALLSANDEARGFHLIEYLLWGEDGYKEISDFNDRQLEYLVAAATDLKNNTQALYTGWIASGDNFADKFLNPTSAPYTSNKSVLYEVANGLETIANEVANGKIEDPLNGNSGSAAPEKEESRFSHNSKIDFANNIKSIQNIYLGGYNTTGQGLSDVVKAENETLDTKVKTQIEEAISAIENINGTFSSAIVNERASVEVAQSKVATLLTTITSEVKPLVDGL